jgi:hypothetical protein
VRSNETMAVTHTVPSTPQTVRSGYLEPVAGPVASVAPGDTVSYPSTWTRWGNEAKFGMSFADREPPSSRVTVACSPGGVRARAGQRGPP